MDVIRGDVVGSLSGPLTAEFAPGDTAEGLRFHPGGFPALFGVPANELVDARVAITEVATGFRSFNRLAATAPRPDPLVRLTWTSRDLQAVRLESGYSERQIRRRVIAATGHGPKRLMRIARMQRVLLGGRRESWAWTVADHGYVDEAHMGNDICQLAGATRTPCSVPDPFCRHRR